MDVREFRRDDDEMMSLHVSLSGDGILSIYKYIGVVRSRYDPRERNF